MSKPLEELEHLLSRLETLEEDMVRNYEEVFVISTRLRRIVERAQNPQPTESSQC